MDGEDDEDAGLVATSLPTPSSPLVASLSSKAVMLSVCYENEFSTFAMPCNSCHVIAFMFIPTFFKGGNVLSLPCNVNDLVVWGAQSLLKTFVDVFINYE